MPRARTGSLWRDQSGRLYARVTWTDSKGKIHDRKRQAMDETHARSLCREMLRDVVAGKRFQPRRARSYRRESLVIYAIQLIDGGLQPVKIGITNNVDKRIKMVLTHQPYEVRLLAAWPGSVCDERAIQAMFRSYNIAREWFRPAPELLAYIAEKNEGSGLVEGSRLLS